ncbi:IS66 family insertion sequence element accessory protein TnpB [Salmonella enterica]|nr:IS66 family insertion sequence element accessory protein TnpB [Salmonella enterica]EEH5466094.1 IS66 family insertion sequence element accessory protein TnpB [Salmonella enterica]EEH7555538.1 IS66 family insertion sequence element accessory protein TnpB [Salmonella enterica]
MPSTHLPQLLPVTLNAPAGPLVVRSELPAEEPETLSITGEVTFLHGTLRLNGIVSERLLTLLIQELKR